MHTNAGWWAAPPCGGGGGGGGAPGGGGGGGGGRGLISGCNRRVKSGQVVRVKISPLQIGIT